MPRGRSEDAVFRDEERRSLSNHVTSLMNSTLFANSHYVIPNSYVVYI
jgi:hypothetical protein